MKGSMVSVRIADFLKQYPPFEFMNVEALRELAGRGKVKFHEDGEIIFSAGQPRDKWLYVIQQGRARVIHEEAGKEVLIDLRGPGDILGLRGIRSDEPYTHTCRTETDTILYALPRASFSELADSSNEARRYLAAYFSLSPAFQWRETHGPQAGEGVVNIGLVTLRKGGLSQVQEPHDGARKCLFTVDESTTVREVARRLQSKRVDCALVVDERGFPVGKVSDADLRDRIVEGLVDPDAPVRAIMFRDLIPAHPAENTGDLLVKLTRFSKSFLVVTEDGTLQSRAVGMVSERNLFLQYGRFPTVIGEAISSAPDVPSLRTLRDRIEALIVEFLDSRESLTWLMRMVGVLNRKLMQRIVNLTLQDMEQAGLGQPPLPYSWLMMGSGGRDELLIRSAVYHALVFDDPESPDQIDTVQRFFKQMAWRVASNIRQCGFLESPQNVLAHHPGWCLSLSAMKQQFVRMIEDPVRGHVYSARDAFDFRPLSEYGCPLADALRAEIEANLREHPSFIRYMAKDSLMNQPPRTIFQGYVVDNHGTQRAELAIKSHALLPLVDVGRVFAIESFSLQETGTYRRLSAAAQRVGADSKHGRLLQEASEAFLVAQYARISQGLRSGTDGAVICPAALDAQTRALLITAFRTIFDLLEFTASRFDLKWRS